MAAAFVQSKSAQAALASVAVQWTTANLSSGNIIWVAVQGTAAAAISVSDDAPSGGNVYTPVRAAQATTGGGAIRMFTAPITQGVGTKPTVTATQTGATLMSIAVHEYSGIDTAAVVDQSATAEDVTGTTATDGETVGPVTPTRDGNMIVSMCVNGGASFSTYVAGTGFTTRETQIFSGFTIMQTEDLVQAVAASISATWTNSANSDTAMQMATLQPPAGGPSTAQQMAAIRDFVASGGMIGRRWR